MRYFNCDAPEYDLTDLYEVNVNGADIPVFSCTVKAKQFATANPVSRYDTFENKNEEAAFVIIDAGASEILDFKVTPKKSFGDVKIRPLSKNITHREENGRISFLFKGPGQFTVEPDDHHGALHVFINDENDYKDIDRNASNVKYFGPGYHNAGRIRLKSGDILFIDLGAKVKGHILEENVENISVIGHGILEKDDNFDVLTYGGITSMPMEIHLIGCSNILIDGITMLGSPMWVICINNCDNMAVNNIKQIGMWQGSSDGFDIVNSQNITLSNSFLRNGDDCVTLKGFAPFTHENVENISVNKCVLWCDWGVALQIGAEACAEFYRNISFTDCDIIHEAQAAMSFQTGGYADVFNIIYDDIRVEYTKHARKPLLYVGDSEASAIDLNNKEKRSEKDIVKIVSAGDVKVRDGYVDELFDTIKAPPEYMENVDYDPPESPFMCWLFHIEICEHWHDILAPDTPFANNHNITIHNINIFSDDGLPVPPSKIKGFSDTSRTYDVFISDIYQNGKKLESPEEAGIIIGDFTDDITFK